MTRGQKYYLNHKDQVKDRMTKWRKENRVRHREMIKACWDKWKKLVYDHYGNKCMCCGETEPLFLSIDHIDGNGRVQRKGVNGWFYRWIVQNDYPNNLQILCMNCNYGKRMNNGICPHKKEEV